MSQYRSQAKTLVYLSSGPLVLAVLSYLLIRYAGVTLSLSEYSLFAAFWSLLMGIGVGLGFPLESFGQNLDVTVSKDLQSMFDTFWTYLIFLTIGFACFLPIIFSRIFEENWARTLLLFLALISFGLIYLGRGIQLSLHDAKGYSGLMSAESLLRILISFILFRYFFESADSFIYGVTFAAIFIGILTLVYILGRIEKNNFGFPKFNKNFSFLVFANLIAFAIMNLSPAIIKLLEPLNSYSGLELNALTLTRSVIIVGPVLQAIVIRQEKRNANKFKSIFISSVILLAIFCLLLSRFGIDILRMLFDLNLDYSKSNLLILSLTSSVYVLTTIIQAKLITQNKFPTINFAWLAGFVVAILTLKWSGIAETVLKTEVSALFGICTSFAYMSSKFSRN